MDRWLVDVGISGDGDVFISGDVSVESEPYIYTHFTPPSNSFGMGETTFKDVNITFYRNWLNNTIKWSLMKSTDGVHWVDCTKILVVDKVWIPENLSEKHTLSWVSDEDAYYNLLLKTSDVKTYQDLSNVAKDKQDRMLLNYSITSNDDYNIYYDWSDYSKSDESSKTSMSKSIDVVSNKQVFSWNVYTSQKLSKGEKFSIDPTFGSTSLYGTTAVPFLVDSATDTTRRASPYTLTENCVAYNMTFNYKNAFGLTSGDTCVINCCIYNYVALDDAGTLVANTSAQTLGYGYSYDNYTLSFPTPVDLNAGTYYLSINAISESLDNGDYLEVGAIALTDGSISDSNYGLENPWTGEVTTGSWTDMQIQIYCTYIANATNTAPTISCQSPVNASTGISLNPTLSVCVNDTDGNTTTVNWYENSTGSWVLRQTNTSVVANSTVTCVASWFNTANTMYWWNVTADDGNSGGNVSSWQYFTTLGNRTSTLVFNYWFLCGNASSRQSTQVFNYWFLCGNVTETRTSTQVFNHWFSCGNGSSRGTTQVFNHWFLCSNTSVRTSTPVFNYWFLCGNASNRQSTQVFNHWFSCGNSSGRQSTQVFNYWFNCGNGSSRGTTQVFNHWFSCGNSSGRQSTQVFNYWFNCSNGTRIDDQVFNHWFNCGNITIINITITLLYPDNNSNNIDLQPFLVINVSHILGSTMNISWYYGLSNGNETSFLNTDTGVTNGSANELLYTAINHSTYYYWRVMVNDGINYVNKTFNFKTKISTSIGVIPKSYNIIGLIGVIGIFGFIGVIFAMRWRYRNNYD